MGAAAANNGAEDDAAAGVAGLAVAAEHLHVHVLLAGLALAIDVVLEAERRDRLDRIREHPVA